MKKRAQISKSIERRLLVESKRRCCLCVFLNQDWEQKHVQIAHISNNPSDSSYDNLVVLCLNHHDEYDSRTSQSKGYTPHEIRYYKNRLKELLVKWEEAPHQLVVPHALSMDLRPSAFAAKEVPISSAPTRIQGLGLDPAALYSLAMDPLRKAESIELLRRSALLSSVISNAGSLKAIRGESKYTGERVFIFVVGDEPDWNFDVLLFTYQNKSWGLSARIPLTGQKGNQPRVRYFPGDRASAISVEHISTYGQVYT